MREIFHNINRPVQLNVKEKKINNKVIISQNYLFWKIKRVFDIIFCLLLLPLFFCIIPAVFLLNLFYNKGPTFFVQKRMGKNCEPFNAIKFRTMRDIGVINRNYLDPIEVDRITKFGGTLRKIRLDELPQIINVIKGDMSLIGPRPDYYDHALSFIDSIPNYSSRHIIRPGISGLSQIRLGYAEGLEATKKKSKVDIFYIENANFYLDLKIFIGTLVTVFMGLGS